MTLSQRLGDIPLKNNRLHFREREIEKKVLFHPQAFNIMVLGDSLTWGAGLHESERYSHLLQTYLQSEYPQKRINVWNFGISGGPTIKERDILRSHYKTIKPHLVIVGFCINDPQPKNQSYSKEKSQYFSKIYPFLNFLARLKLTGTIKLVTKAYNKILIATEKIPTWTTALDRTYDKNSTEWKNFETALQNIFSMSKEVSPHAPIFISLNQGTSNRDPTDYSQPDEILNSFLKWYHQAEDTANRIGFVTVNVEQEFKTKFNGYVMAVVPKEDNHPTKEMNEIYAQKLFSTIKKLSYIQ